MTKKPLTTLNEFKMQHETNNALLNGYAYTRWATHTFPQAVHRNLYDRAAMSLNATNAKSRIAFVKAALKVLLKHVQVSSEHPAFHLTVIPLPGIMSEAQAQQYDPTPMQLWIQDLLAGFEYFAMIDIAPYSNNAPGWPHKPLSWHVHVIVWACSREQMDTLVEHTNNSCDQSLPGFKVAVARVIADPVNLRQKIIYLCKAPLKTYRVYRNKDNQGRYDGTWIQRKASHKTGGQAALVCRVLHGVSIEAMAFDSRNGQLVAKAAKVARKNLRRAGL